MAKKAPSRKSRRAGKGSLFLIAGLLIASALIRVVSDAGKVFAREQDPTTMSDLTTGSPVACETPSDLREMLAAFSLREERLSARESQLQQRMKALTVADQTIAQKLTALTKAEAELKATLALADTAAEGDIARLTTVYETMKPKKAAALFEEMDPDFAAGFLARMRPDAAAGIMAGLAPQTAYTISVVLAGRNADVPKE